jgi:hypothetical protein
LAVDPPCTQPPRPRGINNIHIDGVINSKATKGRPGGLFRERSFECNVGPSSVRSISISVICQCLDERGEGRARRRGWNGWKATKGDNISASGVPLRAREGAGRNHRPARPRSGTPSPSVAPSLPLRTGPDGRVSLVCKQKKKFRHYVIVCAVHRIALR